MVLQLTQNDGKPSMHVSITTFVLLFPFFSPKPRWALEWDYTHLVLVLLCIRTYHLINFFTIELPFRSSQSQWILEWDFIHLVLVLIRI